MLYRITTVRIYNVQTVTDRKRTVRLDSMRSMLNGDSTARMDNMRAVLYGDGTVWINDMRAVLDRMRSIGIHNNLPERLTAKQHEQTDYNSSFQNMHGFGLTKVFV